MAGILECDSLGVMQEPVFGENTLCPPQCIQCFTVSIQHNENGGYIEIVVEMFRSATFPSCRWRLVKLHFVAIQPQPTDHISGIGANAYKYCGVGVEINWAP